MGHTGLLARTSAIQQMGTLAAQKEVPELGDFNDLSVYARYSWCGVTAELRGLRRSAQATEFAWLPDDATNSQQRSLGHILCESTRGLWFMTTSRM